VTTARGTENKIFLHYILYILLTAIGLMPGGSVYKDHIFNNKTAHLMKTAQYIARIFTVQVHEHPQCNTVHIHKYKYMNITKHKKQKMQKKHRKCMKNT
jgi:hypothetical protein